MTYMRGAMAPARRDPNTLLPLSPRSFHVLLTLAEQPQNGYQIMLLVEENSSGKVRVGPGTLYESLHRMREQGLLEEAGLGKRRRADGRGQRFYRLSRFGQRVLAAEARRMADDLRIAQGANVIGELDLR
jgi:DNA-binding PadR family transcriptional regulator